MRGAPISFGAHEGVPLIHVAAARGCRNGGDGKMQLMRVCDRYSAGDSKITIVIKCWQHR